MEYDNIFLNNSLYNHEYLKNINYMITTTHKKKLFLYDMTHKFFFSNENDKTDENSSGNNNSLEIKNNNSDKSLISLSLKRKSIINFNNGGILSEGNNIEEENIIQRNKEIIFLIKKTSKKRNERRYDNCRTKFVRKILNHFFPETISIFIKDNPSKKLKLFPEEFIRQISLVREGEYLNRKLNSLYEDIKLFETENKKIPGKYTKTKIENFDEFMEKPGLIKILDMTFKELVEMYISSGEFEKNLNSMKVTEEDKKLFRQCGKNFIYDYVPKKNNTFLILE